MPELKNDGGQAFPVPAGNFSGGESWSSDNGMSLRDYFAAQALIGMLSQPANNANVLVYDETNTAARWAYGFADAMLAERAK